MPLSQILVELALGLGLALAGANVAVVVQERRRGRARSKSYRGDRDRLGTDGHRLPMGRVWRNIAIGAAVAVWAAVTLMTRG